jgi:hypothetical protein
MERLIKGVVVRVALWFGFLFVLVGKKPNEPIFIPRILSLSLIN